MSEQIPLYERAAKIDEADEALNVGHGAECACDCSSFGSRECYEEAVQAYRIAANLFRDLGLGVKAREAWTRAAECHRKIAEGHERFAKEYEASRDAIEIHWEGL